MTALKNTHIKHNVDIEGAGMGIFSPEMVESKIEKSKAEGRMTQVRILVPTDVFDTFQAIAFIRGLSVPNLLRAKLNLIEKFEISESRLKEISSRRDKDSRNFTFQIGASDLKKLSAFAEQDSRLSVSKVLRSFINDIIEESDIPRYEIDETIKKLYAMREEQRQAAPDKKVRVSTNQTSVVPFFISEQTRIRASEQAKKVEGIKVAELYRRAIMRFEGVAVEEAGMKNPVMTTTRLTSSEKEHAKSIAARDGVSMSAVIRCATAEELERCEKARK